jgi:hypothetical protein
VLLGEEVIDGGWFDELHGTNIEQTALEVKQFLVWRRVDPAPALSPRADAGETGRSGVGQKPRMALATMLRWISLEPP